MTTKMQSCIDHIKTAHDVDPWAMEMVEQIFTEYDKRFDKVLEIIDQMDKENEECNGDPARALLRIEHDDFRERVMELKGGTHH